MTAVVEAVVSVLCEEFGHDLSNSYAMNYTQPIRLKHEVT